MDLSTFLSKTRKSLASAQDHIAQNLSRGSAGSYEDYLKQVGICDGLETAMVIIDEALKKDEENDDT